MGTRGRGMAEATGTQSRVRQYLDTITRDFDPAHTSVYTTASIADALAISRSLASQYLNELVRNGDAVKIDSHPVLFLHKHSFERYLQASVQGSEYHSLQELLASAGIRKKSNFEMAVGYDLSLASCVAQLKSAIVYPPQGLPVLLVGETGTGKALLARCAFSYGQAKGVIAADAGYAYVDCAHYADNDLAFSRDFFGARGQAGYADTYAGGMVFLKNVDLLPRASLELVSNYLQVGDPAKSEGARARIVLSVSRHVDDPQVHALSRVVPITVPVPSLAERSTVERTQLVLNYLRREGRRIAADVLISRGALRALVAANFPDNVDGLRNCVVNCCAGAYLGQKEGRLTIRTVDLPASVLGSADAREDDDRLISCGLGTDPADEYGNHLLRYLEGILDAYGVLQTGGATFDEFMQRATTQLVALQDFLNFESGLNGARVSSYERIINPVVEATGNTYGVDLGRRSVRALAQLLSMRLWTGDALAGWGHDDQERMEGVAAVLTKRAPRASAIVDTMADGLRTALGVELDASVRVLLALDVCRATVGHAARRSVGVIMCHGYATASSIADATNRMLHAHVFEAIDMPNDHEVTDVLPQLNRLLARFSFCRSIVLLVDTGSLESIHKALTGISNADLYVVNNVSTGLALEVGTGLAADEDIDKHVEEWVGACAPAYRVVRGTSKQAAVLFCSESGTNAADRIRELFSASLPETSSIAMVTVDVRDLMNDTSKQVLLDRYDVRAIVGTMDPGVEEVPFVPLENMLYQGSSRDLDRALARELGPDGVSQFHESLVKNLTIQNVIKSITILNPEMLVAEAERGVARLQELTGEHIEPQLIIGIYVHLCSLIERLVTKTPVDSYADIEEFERQHGTYVAQFREAFSEVEQRYRVEFPVSEIAYVYDYAHGRFARRGEGDSEDE